MVDGLDGLRHHAVIGGDHENRDVGELGTAGTHGGECLVARGVEERDLALLAFQIDGHLIGADALGDAAGLAGDDVGLADGVEQSGLTVIDMAHDGDDRRTRLQILVLLQLLAVKVDVELLQQLLVLLLAETIWMFQPISSPRIWKVDSSNDWVAVASRRDGTAR